jgi:hypothetical protein
MSTIFHDLLGVFDRHAIHDRAYANQVARKAATGLEDRHLDRIVKQDDDESFWRITQVSPSVIMKPFTPPAPELADIGKILSVVSDGDSYLKYSWITSPANLTFDDIYNNESGTHEIFVDDGDMLWSHAGPYSHIFDLSGITNIADGFQVTNGTDSVKFLWNAADQINETHSVYSYSLSASDSASIVSSGPVSVRAAGSTSDLTLGGRAQTITLNDVSNTVLTGNIAGKSIFGALNYLDSSVATIDLDDAYNNFGSNPATVAINDAEGQGSLTWETYTDNNFVIDISNSDDPLVNGDTDPYGFRVECGTDYYKVGRFADNQIFFTGNVQSYKLISAAAMDIDSASYTLDSTGIISIDATSTIDWSGTNASLTTAGALAIASDFTLTGGGSILSTSNGDISIEPNGTGNVGVGTSTPDQLLHLSDADTAYLRLENRDTTGSVDQSIGVIEFEGQDTGGDGVRANISAIYEGLNGATALTFGTMVDGVGSVTERLRIDRSGNIGVGTSSPSRRLHVLSSNDRVSYFESTGTISRIHLINSGSSAESSTNIYSDNNSLGFVANSVSRMTIDSSGKIGIGTATPSELLEIEGGSPTALIDATSGNAAVKLEGGSGATNFYSMIGRTDNIFSIQSTAEGNVFNIASGNIGIGNITPNYKFSIGSADNSDQIGIYHDNDNSYFRTTDGSFIFQTDEGTDTDSRIDIRGKGTGIGEIRVRDQDDNEYVEIYCGGGLGYIRTGGVSPSDLILQNTATGNITCFQASAEGETKELKISGYRTGDALRSLQIGVGIDGADQVSFDGLSVYYFNGIVKTTGSIYINEKSAASADNAGFGQLWVKDDTPCELYFTKDDGMDVLLSSGATGDFSGPASSTDNAIVRFDGTGGKTGQNSGVTVDDSDNISTSGDIAFSGDMTASSGNYKSKRFYLSMADDSTYDLPSGTSGIGRIKIGNTTTSFAQVNWHDDGSLSLNEFSGDVAVSDSDGNFCIYPNAGGVRLKNRLGSTTEIVMSIDYF